MRHTVEGEVELLEVLQRMHPDASRNSLRRMLDTGRVRVAGKVERRAKRVVAAGEVVEVAPRTEDPQKEAESLGRGVRIVYEDEHLMAVQKPQGLLTIATDRGEKDTLYDRIFERQKAAGKGGRIFIVHRLDRPTSGVMLFAKQEETKDQLQKAFAEKRVERIYHVVVEGRVEGDAGTVDTTLAESESLQVYVTPSARHGKRAVTHWKVLARGDHRTLVEVRLGSGRRHQIRVHMTHLGHPVVGDKEHGAKSDPLGRLGLHAHRLEFPHPVSGEAVRVTSPTPPAFRRVLDEDPERSRIKTPRKNPHRKRGGRR